MQPFRNFLALCLLGASPLCAQPQPDREALYFSIEAQFQAASTSVTPTADIARIARQAETSFGETTPDLMALVYMNAATLIRNVAPKHPLTAPTYFELVARQRRFIETVSFPQRLWMTGRVSQPLDSLIELHPDHNDVTRRTTELELLLNVWRELTAENDRTKSVDDWLMPARPLAPPSASWPRTDRDGTPIIVIVTENTQPEQVQDPVEREQFRADIVAYREASKQKLARSTLRNDGSSFTNKVMAQVAQEYGKTPHLVGQLQEVMDGYLPPSDSTNIMNKVFAAMPSAVAAKTPRPVPGAKGERWIRVAAVEPKGEPALPAIARPSRIREGMGGRGGQAEVAAGSPGMVAAAEPVGGGAGQPGGRAVWLWAGLGLAAVWLGASSLSDLGRNFFHWPGLKNHACPFRQPGPPDADAPALRPARLAARRSSGPLHPGCGRSNPHRPFPREPPGHGQ